MIGCPAAGVGTAADLSNYPYLSRISVSHTQTATTLMRFLKAQNYTTPVILQDQDVSFYQQMGLVVETAIRKQNPELAAQTLFVPIRSHTVSLEDFQDIFARGMKRSRGLFHPVY